jgi:putative nucleotidyltransferase with HDIG domain
LWAIPQVTLWQAVVAILAVAAAEYFSVTVRDDVHVSLTNMVLLVLILAVGPELAIVAILGVFPLIAIRATDQLLLRISFNTGQYALSAGACGATYVWMASLFGVAFPDPLAILPAAVAALVYSLANYGLVSGVVSASSPDRFWSTFLSTAPSLVMQVPSVGIAILSGVLYLQSPWAIFFMAIPVLVARYSLLAFERLDNAYEELVRGFVNAIEMKDLYTRGHSERVSQLSVLVAEELGVPYDERRLTGYAALLHDVGKVGVSLCIINKPGPLDDEEFEEIKQHPTIGADVLRDIDFLEPAIDIVRYHHERLDGKGYPHGVGEEELSDIVRIVTAVDAFDAMTSTRSYRRALSVDDALAELRRCVGRQFDGRMVEALAAAVERIAWQPTTDFASEEQLHGRAIPTGTAQERILGDHTDSSEVHG